MMSENIGQEDDSNPLAFLSDRSKHLSIEIIDPLKLELLELIEFAPRKLIAFKILYKYVFDNIGLIRAERILTEQELEVLDQFETKYDPVMKWLDYSIGKFRQGVVSKESEGE